MDNIMEFAAFEEIKDGSRNRTAGYTIAWVIGIALLLLIVAAIWNRTCATQMARGAEACLVQNRLGLLEGNQASIGKVLDVIVPDVTAIGRLATGLSVGLDGYVKCTDKDFNRVYGDINKLDNAVFTSRCVGNPYGFDGACGRGGRPEFEQRSTYRQTGDSEVIVRNDCGRA